MVEYELNGDLFSVWFFLQTKKMTKWEYRQLRYGEITALMWLLLLVQLFTFTLMLNENAVAFSWRDNYYYKLNSSDSLRKLNELTPAKTVQHFIVRLLMWLILGYMIQKEIDSILKVYIALNYD